MARCDCILRGENGLANVSGWIDYCPKHAHADAMYGELLELIDICPGCQGMGYFIDWDATEPTKYNCLDCDGARNVIALADGDGGE